MTSDGKITVLSQDKDLAVCLKPRGVLSEGCEEGSMPVRLGAQLGRTVFPVHRLDRETEGLMVYACNCRAAAALSKTIAEGGLEKEYLAVVCGVPVEREGRLTDLLFYDRGRGKSFAVARPRKGVKEAVLDYTVLEVGEGRALLSIQLQTGRTHQIRVQFASRGLPLVGDRRYGAPKGEEPMALCSTHLRFPHPNGTRILDYSFFPLPEEGSAWQSWQLLRDRASE